MSEYRRLPRSLLLLLLPLVGFLVLSGTWHVREAVSHPGQVLEEFLDTGHIRSTVEPLNAYRMHLEFHRCFCFQGAAEH